MNLENLEANNTQIYVIRRCISENIAFDNDLPSVILFILSFGQSALYL